MYRSISKTVGKLHREIQNDINSFLCDINDYITYRLERDLGLKPTTEIRMKDLRSRQFTINRRRRTIGLMTGLTVVADLVKINRKLKYKSKVKNEIKQEVKKLRSYLSKDVEIDLAQLPKGHEYLTEYLYQNHKTPCTEIPKNVWLNSSTTAKRLICVKCTIVKSDFKAKCRITRFFDLQPTRETMR